MSDLIRLWDEGLSLHQYASWSKKGSYKDKTTYVDFDAIRILLPKAHKPHIREALLELLTVAKFGGKSISPSPRPRHDI